MPRWGDRGSADFALLFEFQGDESAARHVLYNCNASRPDVTGRTKEKKIRPADRDLKLTASPAVDTGYVKAKLPASGTGYANFFTAVYLRDAVNNTKGADPCRLQGRGAAETLKQRPPAMEPRESRTSSFQRAGGTGCQPDHRGAQFTIADAYVTGLSLANGTYTIVVEFTKGNSVSYTLNRNRGLVGGRYGKINNDDGRPVAFKSTWRLFTALQSTVQM